MTNRRSDRKGFALPVAIFALVVLGVMVTGGFYIARQQTRIGVATQRSQQALYFAERGLADVEADFATYNVSGLAAWQADTIDADLGDGTYSVIVTRVGSGNLPRSFFLDATGTVTEGGSMMGGATRRLGLYAKLFSADLEPDAALTTVDELKYGGSSMITGIDEAPPGTGWSSECAGESLTDKPGILIDDLDNIDITGNEENILEDQTFGDPKIAEDPTLTPEVLLQFGDLSFDDLVELADYTINSFNSSNVGPTLTAGGQCDTANNHNWGAPTDDTSPCWDHFPIIYYPGSQMDFSSNTSGQGILLIEGDMRITGQFKFYGPVIVKGLLETAGGGASGAHFYGGVIAANVSLNESSVLGNAAIHFSSCAVTRAVLNNTSLTGLRPIIDRAWVDLSNIAY
jgi:hypothetical protein